MPISIKISDSAMSLSSEALSLAATQAMVDGHSKAQQVMLGRMQALYASTGIPAS